MLAGDTDAFGGIVARWQGRMINLAWRFCRDRAMAEDMAQEAFVRAWRALKTFRGESAFSTWLTSIALNVYRSALRDREPLLPPVEPPAAGLGDALSSLMGEERAATVRRLVLTLPRRYREALVVFYFEERNLAEAARILRLSEGTLKSRLHRGRRLLKRNSTAWRRTARRLEAWKMTAASIGCLLTIGTSGIVSHRPRDAGGACGNRTLRAPGSKTTCPARRSQAASRSSAWPGVIVDASLWPGRAASSRWPCGGRASMRQVQCQIVAASAPRPRP